MGSMNGRAMGEAVEEGFPQGLALEWHLQANHYPPLPREFVTVAVAALEKAQDAGPYPEGFFDPEVLDEEVEWPNLGIMPKDSRQDEDGKIFSTVRVAMEAMHLWDFVSFEDEDPED